MASEEKKKISSKEESSRGNRWYEVVRTLRTFYDHFQIAFPDMEDMPKYYSADWAKKFRVSAQKFTRTEDMKGVKKVLDGMGYKTEKWDKIAAHSHEELSQALDVLIDNGLAPSDSSESQSATEDTVDDREPVNEEVSASGNGHALPIKIQEAVEFLGPERWQAFLDDPESFLAAMEQVEKEEEVEEKTEEVLPEESRESKLEGLADKISELETELEAVNRRFDDAREGPSFNLPVNCQPRSRNLSKPFVRTKSRLNDSDLKTKRTKARSRNSKKIFSGKKSSG